MHSRCPADDEEVAKNCTGDGYLCGKTRALAPVRLEQLLDKKYDDHYITAR
jgi:hypothetical protein